MISDSLANHQKLNIIQKQAFHFLMIYQPLFCILVNFCCSDSLTNHQKLNIIQKQAFQFLMIYQPLFCILVNFCCSDSLTNHQNLSSEVVHNPKLSISFFDDLVAIFCIQLTFECNPKMSISFFDNLVAR